MANFIIDIISISNFHGASLKNHNHHHQVSGCSFRDTLELTKHAESLGVAAIGDTLIKIIFLCNHDHFHNYNPEKGFTNE